MLDTLHNISDSLLSALKENNGIYYPDKIVLSVWMYLGMLLFLFMFVSHMINCVLSLY
jgi:hypothetical protein